VSGLLELFRFHVIGMPGAQGSKKLAGRTKEGRGILVESSKKVKPWRQDVKAAVLAVRAGLPPVDGPLVVRMVFTLPKPKSAPKRRRTWPQSIPDVSKLARSTEDAITDAGGWKDDARVVEYQRLAKVFPGEDPESLTYPGVRVVVFQLVDETA
jgi:Holliday junction resolvase RusA-like endonuclease